jgi:hypothetical protein
MASLQVPNGATSTSTTSATSPTSNSRPTPTPGPKEPHTVILGSGIIGLCAAYSLSESGHTRPETICVVDSSPELFRCASGLAAGFCARDCMYLEFTMFAESLTTFAIAHFVRRVRALSRLARRPLLLAPQVPRRRTQRPPNMGIRLLDRCQPEPGL